MKHNIPAARFEEQEADRLIAAFGKKPSEEKQHEIAVFLKGQKHQFLAYERDRQTKSRELPKRSL